jgi:hypothetical protein
VLYDAHTSDLVIRDWERENRRYFIRVVYDSETPGDVPVSGTINNVEIPSTSSSTASGFHLCNEGIPTTLIDILGAGYCNYIQLWANSNSGTWEIYCDDVVQSFDPYNPGISLVFFIAYNHWMTLGMGACLTLTRYNDTLFEYGAQICIKLDFKRRLRIVYTSIVGNNNAGAAAHVNRIS